MGDAGVDLNSGNASWYRSYPLGVGGGVGWDKQLASLLYFR